MVATSDNLPMKKIRAIYQSLPAALNSYRPHTPHLRSMASVPMIEARAGEEVDAKTPSVTIYTIELIEQNSIGAP